MKTFSAPSKGFGLRLGEDIQHGDFVMEYCGEVITAAECGRRIHQDGSSGEGAFYMLALGSNAIIDARPAANLARFANHSCEPNMVSTPPSLVIPPPSLVNNPPSLVNNPPSLVNNPPSFVGKWSVLRVGSEKQGDTLGWHVSGQKMSSASAKWKASPTLVLPGGARHFRFKMTQGAGANSNMAIDKVKLMRGRYSSIMIEECRKLGMKPVCEYRNNCHNDRESLYIGQTYYLTHSSYRNNNNYHACGWNAIRSHWDRGAMGQNICGYSFARGSTDKRAMCSDNNWRTPAQYIGGFMCGVRNHTAMYAHDARLRNARGVLYC